MAKRGTWSARALRIHWPVAPSTLAALAAGDGAALDREPTLATALTLIRSHTILGDFGDYGGVIEIGLGYESFVPRASASPTLGRAGEVGISPTVIVTTYVRRDADEAALDEALGAILAVHPWEVPVVEIVESTILVRG